MIETKEQYEYLKKLTKEMVDYGMQQDILETIEALREVARAGRDLGGYRYDGGGFIVETDDLGRLTEALDALPDWLLEDE